MAVATLLYIPRAHLLGLSRAVTVYRVFTPLVRTDWSSFWLEPLKVR